ncbi:hypothetical protein Dimus_028605 [Dionaea muscipula]
MKLVGFTARAGGRAAHRGPPLVAVRSLRMNQRSWPLNLAHGGSGSSHMFLCMRKGGARTGLCPSSHRPNGLLASKSLATRMTMSPLALQLVGEARRPHKGVLATDDDGARTMEVARRRSFREMVDHASRANRYPRATTNPRTIRELSLGLEPIDHLVQAHRTPEKPGLVVGARPSSIARRRAADRAKRSRPPEEELPPPHEARGLHRSRGRESRSSRSAARRGPPLLMNQRSRPLNLAHGGSGSSHMFLCMRKGGARTGLCPSSHRPNGLLASKPLATRMTMCRSHCSSSVKLVARTKECPQPTTRCPHHGSRTQEELPARWSIMLLAANCYPRATTVRIVRVCFASMVLALLACLAAPVPAGRGALFRRTTAVDEDAHWSCVEIRPRR